MDSQYRLRQAVASSVLSLKEVMNEAQRVGHYDRYNTAREAYNAMSMYLRYLHAELEIEKRSLREQLCLIDDEPDGKPAA
jgi:hypothetical protein